MTVLAGQFRWGTGYENIVSFNYPALLDNARTWRRPAPGSKQMRNGAGVTDAWITARDYLLAGRARHFGGGQWGGPGLQDFLDWAGEGNPFRFVPDDRYVAFYVDGCYLDSPFDDPQPELEDTDGTQAIDVVIRQQTVDFTVIRRGLMFEYAPGKSTTDPVVAAFTRTSTAPYTDINGSAQTAASGVLRDRHYDSGYRTTRLQLNWASQTQPDALYWPTSMPYGVPMSFYVKYIERGAKDTAGGVLIDVGGATAPRVLIRRHATNNTFQIHHDNNVSARAAETGTLAHSIGDLVEIRGVLLADGSVYITKTINSGTESVSAASGSTTPAAWNQARIALGCESSGAQPSDLPLIVARIGLGDLTLTQLRNA